MTQETTTAMQIRDILQLSPLYQEMEPSAEIIAIAESMELLLDDIESVEKRIKRAA